MVYVVAWDLFREYAASSCGGENQSPLPPTISLMAFLAVNDRGIGMVRASGETRIDKVQSFAMVKNYDQVSGLQHL